MSEQAARILVVDDEKNLAEGIRENLEFEGYRTEVAFDGEEGLDKLRSQQFDLILLDVMMPKLNGVEVCEKMRANGIQTPVMFLTVRNDPEDRVRGFVTLGENGRIEAQFKNEKLREQAHSIVAENHPELVLDR